MTLLGIQPESMEHLDLEMTATIKGVFDKVIQNALQILGEWGIENHKR